MRDGDFELNHRAGSDKATEVFCSKSPGIHNFGLKVVILAI